MSAYETWTCDVCSDPPEEADDYVNEDTARDRGWVRVERHTDRPSAVGGGRTWRHHEVGHICDHCLNAAHDREVGPWLADGGWVPYFTEDRERLEQIVALSGEAS